MKSARAICTIFLLLALVVGATCWLLHRDDRLPLTPQPSEVSRQPMKLGKTGDDAANVDSWELPHEVPATVRPIVASPNFRDRFEAVRSLRRNLSGSELDALVRYLRSPGASLDDQTRGQEHALKNEILNLLREQRDPPSGLADLLIGIHQDPNQDRVIRNYALQHLSAWYSSAEESEREKIRRIFWLALEDRETGGVFAGTSLLGLQRLELVEPGRDRERLDAAVISMAQSDGGETVLRITAIQVGAKREIREILLVAVRLVNTSHNAPLVISAIAAIGDLGSTTELALLDKLQVGAPPRLTTAIESARERIKKRQEMAQLSRQNS